MCLKGGGQVKVQVPRLTGACMLVLCWCSGGDKLEHRPAHHLHGEYEKHRQRQRQMATNRNAYQLHW